MSGKTLFIILLSTFLYGCGLVLSPVTERLETTQETLNDTQRTLAHLEELMQIANEQMAEVHHDATLKGAGDNFLDRNKEDMERIRGIQIFLSTADRFKVVWQYMGAPLPLITEKYGPIYNYEATTEDFRFQYPNVSYVNDKALYHRIRDKEGKLLFRNLLKAVSEDLYDILVKATDNGITIVQLEYKGAQTDEDEAKAQDRALRLIHFGTAIYGGLKLEAEADGQTVKTGFFRNTQRTFLQSQEDRAYTANEMKKMLEELGLTDHFPTLAVLVEKRLGLKKEDWDYPESLK